MHKHLLMTFSDDPSALFGLQFVGAFFQNKAEIKFTLLYIAPRTSTVSSQPSPNQDEPVCDLALETARQRLMTAGFAEENLLCKVKKRSVSTAKDIIREGNLGLYDAVILGRRGISRLEELINDSVSMRALDEDRISPLWVCRKPELDRKNVLICIDGSEPSLHIADHVGYVLKGQPGHDVTLFSVVKKGANGFDEAFERAQKALTDNGFPEKQIHSRTQASSDPAGAIEKEARAGRYAAVAVGHSGENKEGFFSIGSVSKKLCYTLSGATLMIG